MKYSPKYILTIGYLLNFIIFGMIITSLGWTLFGMKFKQKGWMITGLIGIVTFLLTILRNYSQVFNFIIPFTIPKFDADLNFYYLIFGTMGVYYILQLYSLWTASGDFETGLIRVSSILFGINLILYFFSMSNLYIAIIGSLLCSAGFYLLKEKKKKIGIVTPQF
jgi:hypothetical protein